MSRRANNLSYEKPEPSFLRKLRNEFGDGSDHHRSRPNPRPAKSKYAEDEDDGPTYVDEDNEVISKEKYLEMVAGPKGDTEENEATKPPADEGAETERRTSKSKQNMAEIGASKKRKQGKVIGGGDVPEDQETSQAQSEAPKRKKNTKKKIKLSFDDEE
ncbi:hypothetical protein H112_00173 [Trichophyton rubrum D6]|uniref:DUF4604 domain-containing protein n=4 Tax=Trichophyton TaxID=5550 RepID=A0A178F7L5_TRIRU|nr:uncharacterized protein TERG_08492 [Trichophyton rubrum CBS 118892]EZF27928.1 hypothetical protein H100_00173 [Trichophyton rubrum MR850]EZF46934.1 hypothetical protein H102_00172 [Trichophyton rubrum CBS 100081]EZF57559.1 hypothetical protein H103_00174 [Trichophyton rubrum CBS 288.86]EZF68212.1 hypothetical protein H104_00173 [Trichophyton rubrum CBS 289.86]EZF78918.1 hypothetical protein H105_00164 [Trichophyton soudanense CBS 452.61]EZF89497.1 hypothetical protein H110_00173 [Trichophy